MKKIIFITFLLIATFFISVLIFIPDSPFGRDVKDFFTINKKISIDEYEKVVSENEDLKKELEKLQQHNRHLESSNDYANTRIYNFGMREEELVANYNNLIDEYKDLQGAHNELLERSKIFVKSIRNSQQSAAINNLIKSLGGNSNNSGYKASLSLSSQEVSLNNRICYYNTISGKKAINVSIASSCPMSYPRIDR